MFQIDTDVVRITSYSIDDCSRQLNRDYHRIAEVKVLLRGNSAMNRVIGTLNSLQGDVMMEARQEEALYNTVQMITKRYADCEQAIVDNMDNGKFGIYLHPAIRIVRALELKKFEGLNRKVLGELLELFY